jgi:hypothetical protein
MCAKGYIARPSQRVLIAGVPSWKPDLSADSDELTQRVTRLRQQSEALDDARSAAERGRNLIEQMKRDADDLYKALTSGKPPR